MPGPRSHRLGVCMSIKGALVAIRSPIPAQRIRDLCSGVFED